ncbi:hypothetical protein EVAR_89313_1 [Eumeta japonica]|uniref:Uncharacterized protein n=1 Tax=Eumeta variegata TaxID=151549 RepID=A0A4C1YWV1_EUMVA|nr:hypothetical protein EVAR_89313_1 [Eumeta japonica]
MLAALSPRLDPNRNSNNTSGVRKQKRAISTKPSKVRGGRRVGAAGRAARVGGRCTPLYDSEGRTLSARCVHPTNVPRLRLYLYLNDGRSFSPSHGAAALYRIELEKCEVRVSSEARARHLARFERANETNGADKRRADCFYLPSKLYDKSALFRVAVSSF